MKNFIGSFLILLLTISTAVGQRGYVRGAIEDKYEDKYMNDSSSALKQWMYGNLMNVKVEPVYNFTQTMLLHTTTYKKDKIDRESDMDVYMNATKKTMAYHVREKDEKKDDITMIYDFTQNAMITLNKKEKTGFAMTMNAFMSKEAQDKLKEAQSGNSSTANTDCKKTGNSKMIQGYKCDEYVCINTEKSTKVVLWICPTLYSQNMAATMFKGYAGTYSFPSTTGMALECEFYKSDVLEMKMNVTEFNKAANMNISTTEYAINKM